MGYSRQETMGERREGGGGIFKKERSLSEAEKMQRLVGLCEKLELISAELKRRGYDEKEVPIGFYSSCKAIVNYIEGFARESKVKPSKLSAIRFRKSRRVAVTKGRNSSNSNNSKAVSQRTSSSAS